MAAYEVTTSRLGRERVHHYVSDEALEPGDVIRLGGRDLLLASIDGDRVTARPARYRLSLRHGDGRVEAGAFRRWRPDAPRVGHSFTTLDGRSPVGWAVVEEELAFDDDGEPFIELVATRDFDESDGLGIHELEHAVAREDGEAEAARAVLERAADAGLSAELVALEAGDAPDWDAAARLIDSLVLEELEDDLIELCGIDPDTAPRDTWLDRVKERLRVDLERFRADVEGGHDQIEEWDFRDGRIFASVGRESDEAEPDSGHGWLVRLNDSEALGAAGFKRVRKAELDA